MNGAAEAADIETAPVFDWTGFYVGAYAGVAWADGDVDDTTFNTVGGTLLPVIVDFINALDDFSFSPATGIYGVQAGYKNSECQGSRNESTVAAVLTPGQFAA
jgi:hypothetical protein